MKKMFLFLLTGVIVFWSYAAYAQELPKTWSRISTDEINAPVPADQNYIYNPAPQVEKTYEIRNTRAVVYPNYRPFPGSNTTQSELSIDIHPLNGNIIFCSANATNWPFSTIWGTGIYYTFDGGSNWTGYNNPPFGTNSGDPVSVIGTNGYLYEGYIHSNGGQGVSYSTNNGTTWSSAIISLSGTGFNDLLDKNHMWIDKKVGSPYENRVYAAWTRFHTGHVNNNKVEVSYSSNNGATWSTPVNVSAGVNAGSHDQGVNLQTGPNGEVYAIWAVYDNWASGVYGEDAIGYNVSTDGGQTWGTARKIYTAANFGIRGMLKPTGQVGASAGIRVSSFPSLAVNRTTGDMYAVWPQRTVAPAGTSADIVSIRSTDGGLTWSAPVRVNDDLITNGKDQYYPWVTVDQTSGAVYTVFYDGRNVANDSSQVYMARSIDGGLTFENLMISDAAFKPKPISGLAGGYQGDYIGITALDNTVYAYWADDRTGNYQGWIGKASFGPNILHTPLGNTENLNGPYVINTTIESNLPLVNNRLYVYYWRDNGAKDSVLLVNTSGNSFTASIPGNGTQATYHYYLSAQDNTGGVSTLPGGAPANNFSFEARTDVIAPVIAHTVLPNQYRENWPAQVSAVVTDNIGVDSVWVEYKLNSAGSTQYLALTMSAGNWVGTFGIDTSLIVVGDSLKYRIVAKDASAAHNLGYHPSQSGWNIFTFIPDTDLPVIVHTPLRDQPIIRWPAEVRATVTDLLGIQGVSVEYSLNNGAFTPFNLNNTNGNTWSAVFPLDTTQVHPGDSIRYRIKAVDNSVLHNFTYFPANGYLSFDVIATKGIVLVINDDLTLEDRVSDEKPGGEIDRSVLGASSSLISTVLTQSGYVVDSVTFAALNVANLNSYDILALCAGAKTSTIFEDPVKRTAIVNFTLAGGKVFVEGGEVGYVYRKSGTTTDKDPNFRRNILYDSTWLSDVSSGLFKKRIPGHIVYNSPHYIPDSLAFTGTTYGVRDAMSVNPAEPGIYKLGSWWGTYAEDPGIIAYSPIGDINNIRNLFCTFSVGALTNQVYAAKLVENLFEYLTFGVVPVELTAFNVTTQNGFVNLSWQTASELNNSGFEIQRRSEDNVFTKIGFVPGKGTTTNLSSYVFVDDNIASGKYIYRLKQIDYDGTISYSQEILVDVTVPALFELSQNYPNPFNPSTSISYSVPMDGMVTLAVYNLLGEKVATLVNMEMKSGRYEVKFDASSLSSGLYFYRLDAGNYSSVKKMMLLK
jgi:hypothetical protein